MVPWSVICNRISLPFFTAKNYIPNMFYLTSFYESTKKGKPFCVRHAGAFGGGVKVFNSHVSKIRVFQSLFLVNQSLDAAP
jgi:hypothetical protein